MMATHEMLKKVVQEELGTVFFGGGKNGSCWLFWKTRERYLQKPRFYRYSQYSVRFQQITGDI